MIAVIEQPPLIPEYECLIANGNVILKYRGDVIACARIPAFATVFKYTPPPPQVKQP